MAEYIKLSELEKAVFVKQEEEKQYWFDWLKQFRATKEYSVKEQAVDNFLRGYGEAVQYMLSVNEQLLLKSADVVEVVHGRWVRDPVTGFTACSYCGMPPPGDAELECFYESDYCPNCGAKMDGGADEGEIET